MRIIFVIIISLFWNETYSQNNIEYSIFKEISKELLLINQNKKIKNSLKSFKLQYSVVPLELVIDTIRAISNEEEKILADIDKNTLINILKEQEVLFFPMPKKIMIIDTIGFFYKNYTYQAKGYKFKILKNKKCKKEHLTLYAYKIKDDNIILSLVYKKEKYYFINLYLKGAELKLYKRKIHLTSNL